MNLIRTLTWMLVLINMSCQTSSKRAILNPEIRYMADTMFARQKILIAEEMDSLCNLRIEEFKTRYIDSLLEVEKRRIEELID